jgi:hypothetical protein
LYGNETMKLFFLLLAAICLQPGAVFSLCLPLTPPTMSSISYLDSRTGLWDLPARIPLPPDRLSLMESLSKFLASGFPVTTDGRHREHVVLTPEELHNTFLPLCLAIREREDKARAEGRRCIVGFIGPPGAGKSTFAETLRCVYDAVGAIGDGEDSSPPCVVLGGDGYHLRNSELEAVPLPLPGGGMGTLRRLKGLPQTMDGERCAADLARCQPRSKRVADNSEMFALCCCHRHVAYRNVRELDDSQNNKTDGERRRISIRTGR